MQSIFSKVFPVSSPLGFHIKGYGTGYYLVPVGSPDRFFTQENKFLAGKSIDLMKALVAFTKRAIAYNIMNRQTTRVDLVEVLEVLVTDYPFLSRDVYLRVLDELAAAHILKNVEHQKNIETENMKAFDTNNRLTVKDKPVIRPTNYVLWEDKESLQHFAEDFRALIGISDGRVTDNELTIEIREMFGIRYRHHTRVVEKLEFILELFKSKDYLAEDLVEDEVTFYKYCEESYRGIFAYYIDKLKNFYDEGEAGSDAHRDLLEFLSELPLERAMNGLGLQRIVNEQSQEIYEKDLQELAESVYKRNERLCVAHSRSNFNFSSLVWELENRYDIGVDYVDANTNMMLCINARVPEIDYVKMSKDVIGWLLKIRTGEVKSNVSFRAHTGWLLTRAAANMIIRQSEGLMKQLGWTSKGELDSPHLTGVIGIPDVIFTRNANINHTY